ncbi:PREDICTED: uncharacterized protein LOC106912947, partial [Poecilia mexicana]|uniref:uncharacterized protein LOC106912947 n=1 Tax=Poecilia mexicana TaxID=48701 RepID=UPI00072DF787
MEIWQLGALVRFAPLTIPMQLLSGIYSELQVHLGHNLTEEEDKDKESSLNGFIYEFIAAEETFTEFKDIIVKSEEEMDDQRRLLDFSRTPRIILHRIDSLKCKVNNQERKSTLDQEEFEPLQVKQEQEEPEDHQIKAEEKEVYCSQGEEQIELKQETDTYMVVPVDEQTNQTESEPNRNQDIFQEAAEAENRNQDRRKPFS